LSGAKGLAVFGLGFAWTAAPAAETVKVRLSVDEDPIVLRLAASLGYFREAGVEIVPVKVDDFEKEDYLLQAPLNRGQIDAAYHWFNHTVFGARHHLPVKAVMVFNDAPGMTVMVANRVKDRIRSAADFGGRNIAQGAGYGTKSVLTSYLALKSGLARNSYTPVLMQSAGRQEAVLDGLRKGTVDVLTFQEPLTSVLLATGQVTMLYDLNSRETTTKVLGAPWPAQSLLMAPHYIEKHPETVQKLVNALVKTMRFINAHTAEQIAEKLPPEYFADKDRAEEIAFLRNTLPTYARDDYSVSPAAVQLVVETILSSDFDRSEEGRWRAEGDNAAIRADQLYDNRFVAEAMKTIK
jgi:NitT/TauT family transport system substrate-binding protein